MKILGIDIGTTGICGLLFNTDGFKAEKVVTLPNDSFIDTDLEYEKIQNPEAILETVRKIISLIDEKPDSIGLSCQMHGVMYIDCEGNSVSPLYIWQDMRGAELLYRESYADYLGTYPGYGLSTVTFNQLNDLTPVNAKYICTIGDYIAIKLCGITKPLMHITNAASFGCFDLVNYRFDYECDLLPEITSEFDIVGNTSDGVPVTVCIGDNQAGFIGSVPTSEGVLLNIGTGAQISYLINEYSDNETAEIRPFDGSRYLVAGCSLCGGRAFAIFEKFCREIAIASGSDIKSFYPIFDKVLTDCNNSGVTADCRFCGTRKNKDIKGGIFDLTENNFSYENIASAILDGMIKELYDMYDSDKSADCIVCCGNGIRKNPLLKKYIEKYFGVRPMSTAFSEEAAFGAALTSAVSIGVYSDIDKARSNIELVY